MPACSSAARPASTARPAVVPPMRRSQMPLRSRIHSSLVSRVAARSSLVTILSGRAAPQPAMRAVLIRRSCRAEPRNGLARHHPLPEMGEHALDAPGERGPDLGVADGAEQIALAHRLAAIEIGSGLEESCRGADDD